MNNSVNLSSAIHWRADGKLLQLHSLSHREHLKGKWKLTVQAWYCHYTVLRTIQHQVTRMSMVVWHILVGNHLFTWSTRFRTLGLFWHLMTSVIGPHSHLQPHFSPDTCVVTQHSCWLFPLPPSSLPGPVLLLRLSLLLRKSLKLQILLIFQGILKSSVKIFI